MPSKAALDFGQARVNARLLITAASIPPSILANSAIHKAACLHAALAMLVAAWEAYLERLVREIQREFADTTQVRLSVVL